MHLKMNWWGCTAVCRLTGDEWRSSWRSGISVFCTCSGVGARQIRRVEQVVIGNGGQRRAQAKLRCTLRRTSLTVASACSAAPSRGRGGPWLMGDCRKSTASAREVNLPA